MAKVVEINAVMGVNNADFKKGLDAAGKDAKSFADKTKGVFADLNDQFGKKSLLGKSLKIMAGGGAIAAIKMAASEFQHVSEKVEEMAAAYRKGEVGAGEMIGTIAREIPILGELTKGFDALREAMTGEKAAIMAEWNAYEETSLALQKQRLEKTKEETKATKDFAAALAELNKEWRLHLDPGAAPEIKFEDRMAGYTAMHEKNLADNPLPEKPNAAALAAAKKDAQETAKWLRDTLADPKNTQGEIDRIRAIANASAGVYSGLKAQEAAYKDAVEKRTQEEQRYAKLRADAFRNAAGDIHDAEAAAQEKRRESVDKFVSWWRRGTTQAREAHEKMIAAEKKATEEAAEDARKAGERTTEAMRTPMEKYAATLKQLKEQYDAGNINAETLGRAGKDAYADLERQAAGPAAAPRLMAEYAAAPHRVTEADGPAPLSELANTAKAQLVALQELVKQGGGTAKGPDITLHVEN